MRLVLEEAERAAPETHHRFYATGDPAVFAAGMKAFLGDAVATAGVETRRRSTRA